MAKDPEKKRFIFAWTNADVDGFNRDIRAWRKERGEIGADHSLQTKDGAREFAAGDRIQFTGNARRKRARDLGFTNGRTGTITEIDGARVTVELDGISNSKTRLVAFTVGDNADAGQFNAFRHGYAGTIYKGQGKTLDETYLYHSRHWGSAAGYVALTRHRENASVFVGRDVAGDVKDLARQMARFDDRRAASQFHHDGAHEGRTRETSRADTANASRRETERGAAATPANTRVIITVVFDGLLVFRLLFGGIPHNQMV
jgi:ATP-dependent exoDNAse (exonuclease V) alpha subunit